MKKKQQKVSKIECPECNSLMLLKKANGVPFFGCPDYPDCEQTVKIRKEFRDLSDEELLDSDEDICYI